MHRPTVTDVVMLREYRQDLVVSIFYLAWVSLRSQVQGQILKGESIPILIATFSRVMRIFTGANISPASSIEQSAMVSESGRDRGRGRNFGGGCGSFVGDRGMVVDKMLLIRDQAM